MGHSAFRFKQFLIHQDRCAMKVGTDGVLIGSWAGKNAKPRHILDVGAGTGLISLMMAQRFPDANVNGVEINHNAAVQAQENAANSPFTDRVEIVNTDLFLWNSTRLFDLIVSNPPFYEHAYPSKSSDRDTARHGNAFSMHHFLMNCAEIVSTEGILSIIVPQQVHSELNYSNFGWYPKRICEVYPKPQKKAHRIMVELQKKKQAEIHEKLIIENEGRHQYSPEYIALTRDFYLRM